jgi:hypothetical protein
MTTTANLPKKEMPYRDELQLDLGLLSKSEVARLLRVSCCTIDRYVKKGWLKVKKLGTEDQSRCFYEQNEVLRFVRERIK